MSKPVMITTDSTCDLTLELMERFQIKAAPLHILLGDEEYLDGVNFTQEMIFDSYAKTKILPRTSAVTPQEFIQFFTPLVEAGYEVVHIDISSKISGTYQNAVIAAEDLPGVYPIDSQQLTTGMSEMVLAACRMRDEGKSAQEIVPAVTALIPKVNTSFVIDTLEYLWKGGRCSGVAAFGANLLKLKPCIELHDGALEVARKYRGNIVKVYDKYITDQLTGRTLDPHYLFITTANELPPELQDHLSELIHSLVDVKEIFFTRTGCTVTSHCGPGTLGCLFLEA